MCVVWLTCLSWYEEDRDTNIPVEVRRTLSTVRSAASSCSNDVTATHEQFIPYLMTTMRRQHKPRSTILT